jgi:hypothetical protein
MAHLPEGQFERWTNTKHTSQRDSLRDGLTQNKVLEVPTGDLKRYNVYGRRQCLETSPKKLAIKITRWWCPL